MTTVINNPGDGGGSNSAVGMIVGIIALVVVVGLFFIYVLPAIQNREAPKSDSIDVNIKIPTADDEEGAGN